MGNLEDHEGMFSTGSGGFFGAHQLPGNADGEKIVEKVELPVSGSNPNSPTFQKFLVDHGYSADMPVSEFLKAELKEWENLSKHVAVECDKLVKDMNATLAKGGKVLDASGSIVDIPSVSVEPATPSPTEKEIEQMTYKIVDTVYDAGTEDGPSFFSDIYADRSEVETLAKAQPTMLTKIIEWQKAFVKETFTDTDYTAKAKKFLDGFHNDRNAAIKEAASMDCPKFCPDGIQTNWRLLEIKGWFMLGRFDKCAEQIKKLHPNTLKHIFFVRFSYALSMVDMYFRRRKRDTGAKIPYAIDDLMGWREE
jgi:hypothetical protein